MNDSTRNKDAESDASELVTTCISLDRGTLEDARMMARLAGFEFSFSAYVRDLLRKDVEWRSQGRNQRSV